MDHTYYLNPSKLFVSAQRYEVITVLGSCVAVCLYDRKLHLGGINHYMLPFWNGRDLPSLKFGNIAIDKLIEKMVEAGGRKKEYGCEGVWRFGGYAGKRWHVPDRRKKCGYRISGS